MYILADEFNFDTIRGIVMDLYDSAVSVFSKIAFRFEFLFPQFIGYVIGQKLKNYKEKGILEDYKIKSKRKGKYHYFFDLDLFLNIEKGGELSWLTKRKDT